MPIDFWFSGHPGDILSRTVDMGSMTDMTLVGLLLAILGPFGMVAVFKRLPWPDQALWFERSENEHMSLKIVEIAEVVGEFRSVR